MTEEHFNKIFRSRSYIHFDHPLGSVRQAWQVVRDPRKISLHSFLPFLAFRMTSYKIFREGNADLPRSRRKIVIKPKHREIKISSHRDAAIYTYYGGILSESYERKLSDLGIGNVVTAFRSSGDGKCNIDHAKEVFDFIKDSKPCVALAFDITKFFDTLSHEIIKKSWMNLLNVSRLPDDHYRVFNSMTRFSWVSRKSVYEKFNISESNPKAIENGRRRSRICNIRDFRNLVRGGGMIQHNPRPDAGIPQGSPMSALLSNIYMLDFDKSVSDFVEPIGGFYRRYCDDIMVIVPPEFQDSVNSFVHSEISKLAIECNPCKTEIVDFPLGSDNVLRRLQYLGFYFDGSVIRLRQGSLDRYYGKMRRGVRFAVQCQKKSLRYSKNHVPLKTRKIYLKYSYLVGSQRGGKKIGSSSRGKYSKTNFISYGLRASEILNSSEIRNQIRNHWKKLIKQIRDKEIKPLPRSRYHRRNLEKDK